MSVLLYNIKNYYNKLNIIQFKMFCKNPQYSAKLIDIIFIAGIKSENIKSYLKTKDSNYLNAECLLTFPNVSDMVNPGVLEVIKIRKILTVC
jgi:hypothetical protein